MNEIILDAIYVLIGLVIAIGSFIMSMNFLTKGMILAYMRVRMSMGKKVLVRVNSVIDKYWTTGQLKERVLYFRIRNTPKDTTINNICEEHYYYSMGVHCIDVNEGEPNPFAYARSGEVPQNLPDPAIYDNLLQRALMSPSDTRKEFIILLICIILVLVVAGFAAYKSNQAVELINVLRAVSGNI